MDGILVNVKRWLRFSIVLAMACLAHPVSAQELAARLPLTHSVTPGGSTVAQLPVPMLPGAGGLEPKLVLSYSSQGSNVGFGLGWSLQGYLTIARGNKSWTTDGSPGGIAFGSADAFYLNGERLVPTRRTSFEGRAAIQYRKESDDATVVYAFTTGSGEISSFLVETKSGLYTVLDVPVRGYRAVPSAFLPSKTYDTSGNYINWTFTVSGMAYELTRVTYTGHDGAAPIAPFAEITFTYEPLATPIVSYVLGDALERRNRLVAVSSRLIGAPPQQDLHLRLHYRDVAGGNRFYLEKAQLTAFGKPTPPVALAYQSPGITWTEVPDLVLPVPLAGQGATDQAYRLIAHKTGSTTRSALLFSAENKGELVSRAYISEPTGWREAPERAAPVAFLDNLGRSTGVLLQDLDGDGATDIVQGPAGGKGRAWRQTAAGWDDMPSHAPNMSFLDPGGRPLQTFTLNLDSDGRDDLIVRLASNHYVALRNERNGWVRSLVHEFTSDRRQYFRDFDCDGFVDRAEAYRSGTDLVVDIHTGSSGGWTLRTESSWAWRKAVQGQTVVEAVQLAGAPCGALMIGVGPTNAFNLTILQGSGTGWESPSATLPRSPFHDAAGAPLFPVLADVDGDGDDDILVARRSGNSETRFAWTQDARASPNDPAVWTPNPGLSPPALIAGEQRFADVQLADVNGDAAADILALPSARDPGGSVYLAAGNQWQLASNFSPAVQLAHTKENAGFLRFVDWDSDGLQDIVYHDGAQQIGARRNTGGGWEVADQWAPPRALQRTGDVSAPGTFVDVNSDGFPDLVYAYQDSAGASIRETYLNPIPTGGQGWGQAVPTWTVPVDFAASNGGDLGARFADVNADGRVDIVTALLRTNQTITARTFLNSGGGWTETQNFLATAAFVAEQRGSARRLELGTELIDIDGDRFPDLVAAYRHPTSRQSERKGVFRNDGRAFAQASSGAVPVMLDSPYYEAATNAFVHFNDDGNLDIVKFTSSGSEVFLGTGGTWVSAPNWRLPAEVRSAVHGFAATRFVDLNGDGLDDIVYHWPAASSTDHKGNFINTGSGWSRGPPSLDPAAPLVAENGTDNGVRQVDVNADGAVDLIRSARDSNNVLQRSAHLSPGRRAGMLTLVTDGSGIRSSYSYAPLSEPRADGTLFTKARPASSVYPVIPLTPFSPVVQNSTVDEGGGRVRKSRYAYIGFRFDVREARPLGFERWETVDEDAGITRRFEYLQTLALIGRPRREVTEVALAPGAAMIVNIATKAWSAPLVDAPEAVHGRVHRFFQPRIDSTGVEERDLTGAALSESEASFTYDEWGNATHIETLQAQGATKQEVNVFNQSERFARFGRLTRAEVRLSKPNEVEITRATMFEYDPVTLLLKSEELDVGDPNLGSQTVYTRDVRGNVETVTRSAAGAASRVTTLVFDAWKRSVRTERNPLNHEAHRLHSGQPMATAMGLPTEITDPNGRRSRIDYDELGRPVRLRAAHGTVELTERLHPAALKPEWLVDLRHSAAIRPSTCRRRPLPAYSWSSPELGFSEVVWFSGANGARRLAKATIYDRAGRVVRVVLPRTDGAAARLVFIDTEYDLLGRAIGVSAPYFSGAQSRWSRFLYDPLNRRVAEIRIDGACNEIAFDGLNQRRTDAKGRVTVVRMNGDGQAESVKRPDGATTTFVHDAMGRVRRIIKPGGNVTQFGYDAAGNRNMVDEPNGRKVEFKFDGFGQMRGEKAAAQVQWAEIDYDKLGRVERLWRSDQVTTWKYDGQNAIGALSGTETRSQNVPAVLAHVESYQHNMLGQLIRTTVSVTDGAQGTQFTGAYTFSYNPFGELESIVYPKSGPQPEFAVRREYDADSGQLVGVRELANATRPLWQLVSADAQGRALSADLGNGTRETRTYSTNTGRLWSLKVNAGTNRLWDSTYDYDDVGNLKTRRERVKNVSEAFGYDVLDRLVRSDDGQRRITAIYDAMGRLASKSDVGTYHYGCNPGDGPHAVCRISRSGQTTKTLAYNAYGSIERTDDMVVAYTSDHHVLSLTTLTEEGEPTRLFSNYFYGPRGQRVLSRERGCADSACFVHRTKETLHLGLYDRIAVTRGSSVLITDRYYVAGPDGVVLTVDAVDRRLARGPERNGTTRAMLYRHQDQLGSAILVTGDGGRVIVRPRYDPWGRLRGGLEPADDNEFGLEAALTRGYAGQDHIPQFALVHMNGRIYDPHLGLFLSVDPLLTDPYLKGDLNPYLYVDGNPLLTTDPSGFGLFDDVVSGIGNAIGGIGNAIGGAVTDLWNAGGDLIKGTGEWIGKNWREVVTVAVIISVTVAAGPAGPVVAAMAAGAAGGATYTALYGGNLQEVVAAAIVGGVTGGLTAGIANAGLGPWATAGLQGFVSGVQTGARGGSFEKGFLIGAISHGVRADRLVDGTSGWAVAGRVAIRASANGTISELQGGKFANGAMSGAFEQLYADANAGQWRIRSVIQIVGAYQAREATLIGLGAASVTAILGFTSGPTLRGGALFFVVNHPGASGITIGSVILYGGDADIARHELRHVASWSGWGSREFFRQYTDQLMRFGYCDAPFESEGYAAENRARASCPE